MACNAQTLLDQNPCLAAYPPFIDKVIVAQGLCTIATSGFTPTPPGSGGPIWNPEQPGGISNPDGGPLNNPQV